MPLQQALLHNGHYIVYIVFKVLMVGCTWFGGYIAEKIMNDAFVQRVYLSSQTPPSFANFVINFALTYLAFAAVAVFVLCGGLHIAAAPTAVVYNAAVYCSLDALAAAGLFVILAWNIGWIITTKRYFNYTLEGLRAIRAMRHICTFLLSVLTVLPIMYVVRMQPRATPVQNAPPSNTYTTGTPHRGLPPH